MSICIMIIINLLSRELKVSCSYILTIAKMSIKRVRLPFPWVFVDEWIH